MSCPFLEYRDAAGDRSFDVARAYCTANDAFVQPMRADICTDRYALDHAEHCEIYREHADQATDEPSDETAGETTDERPRDEADAP